MFLFSCSSCSWNQMSLGSYRPNTCCLYGCFSLLKALTFRRYCEGIISIIILRYSENIHNYFSFTVEGWLLILTCQLFRLKSFCSVKSLIIDQHHNWDPECLIRLNSDSKSLLVIGRSWFCVVSQTFPFKGLTAALKADSSLLSLKCLQMTAFCC